MWSIGALHGNIFSVEHFYIFQWLLRSLSITAAPLLKVCIYVLGLLKGRLLWRSLYAIQHFSIFTICWRHSSAQMHFQWDWCSWKQGDFFKPNCYNTAIVPICLNLQFHSGRSKDAGACTHSGHNMCSKELYMGGSCHKVYEILFVSDNLREIRGENTMIGKRRKRDSVAPKCENIWFAYNSSLDFSFQFYLWNFFVQLFLEPYKSLST